MESIYELKDLHIDLDLDNYYFFKNGLTDLEIDKIFDISKKYIFQNGKINKQLNTSYRNSKIKWIPQNDETKWLYNKIRNFVKEANSISWNFDLIGFGEDIQIGEYNSKDKGHYDWHLDIGKNSINRKISISIQLSDPNDYEGGELEFKIGKNIIKAPKEKGTVILFPSYLLHRVTSVIKGKRVSLVLWISGPPFK